MTDTRRQFLLRFAATALASAAAGCEVAPDRAPEHNVVYGPPPGIYPRPGSLEDFAAKAGGCRP